jgi:hypothetical protein
VTLSKLRTASLLATLGLFVCLPSCGGTIRVRYDKSQRWPGPMTAESDPLPPGDESLYPPGPEEIVVIRHADPVHVRPAGTAGAYPLTFYDKERRMNAGGWIYTNQGGRVELIWPSGSSISLNNQSTGVLGSPSRGEPLLFLWELDYARIEIGPEDSVQLLGGAVLRSNGGTVIVEHPKREIERVRNQTKGEIRIDYRDEVFVLDPGQVIDLPLLSTGAEPLAVIPGARSVAGDGFQVDVLGRVSVVDDERGVRLHADGEHQIRGLGVRVRLLEGEEVLFESLGASGQGWRPPVEPLPRGALYKGQEPPVENP